MKCLRSKEHADPDHLDPKVVNAAATVQAVNGRQAKGGNVAPRPCTLRVQVPNYGLYCGAYIEGASSFLAAI